MFDYYRFRFSMFKGWTPEVGYGLMAPAGIFGAVLILAVLYLTSPDFGLLMWRAGVPLPAQAAFGLVIFLLILTYLADDLKRLGLWLIVGACVSALVALIPLTYSLSEHYTQGFYEGMETVPSAKLVGGAFAVYLVVMLYLTFSRLRDSDDR